jgi:N-methylhydantoinase A
LDGISPDRRSFEVSLDLRYLGQVRGVTLPIDLRALEGDDLPTIVRPLFLREYETQFFYAPTDVPIEVAAVRVRGYGYVDRPPLAPHSPPATVSADEPSTRAVLTASGQVSAALYVRGALQAGNWVAGPAIVYQTDSTTWVPTGWRCAAQDSGHLLLQSTDMRS